MINVSVLATYAWWMVASLEYLIMILLGCPDGTRDWDSSSGWVM